MVNYLPNQSRCKRFLALLVVAKEFEELQETPLKQRLTVGWTWVC